MIIKQILRVNSSTLEIFHNFNTILLSHTTVDSYIIIVLNYDIIIRYYYHLRVVLHPGPTCSIYVRDKGKFSHIHLTKDSRRIQIAMGQICCLLEPLCSFARAWFDADIVVCVYLLQNKSTLKITTPSSILRALGQS